MLISSIVITYYIIFSHSRPYYLRPYRKNENGLLLYLLTGNYPEFFGTLRPHRTTLRFYFMCCFINTYENSKHRLETGYPTSCRQNWKRYISCMRMWFVEHIFIKLIQYATGHSHIYIYSQAFISKLVTSFIDVQTKYNPDTKRLHWPDQFTYYLTKGLV